MKKPTKKIIERQSIDYNFNWVSKKVGLEDFTKWCKLLYNYYRMSQQSIYHS